MISRNRHAARLTKLLARHPCVALLGARQAGKTTLARALAKEFPKPVTHFDLEDPDDLARLAESKIA